MKKDKDKSYKSTGWCD